jgi:hypothetical protein
MARIDTLPRGAGDLTSEGLTGALKATWGQRPALLLGLAQQPADVVRRVIRLTPEQESQFAALTPDDLAELVKPVTEALQDPAGRPFTIRFIQQDSSIDVPTDKTAARTQQQPPQPPQPPRRRRCRIEVVFEF